MCHMFPGFREKPAFPARDASINKRNLFLLSGRVVFHCRHKSQPEKQVLTDRKNNFQILIVCENKLSKTELYKSNFIKKITECNYLFIADIIVNHLYTLFLRSRKTNTKCYNKKRKKSVAGNIVASKKISFSDLCQARFSRSGKLRSNVKS